MNPTSYPKATSFVEKTIPSDPLQASSVQNAIEALLQQARASEQDIFCVRLAMEEALVNAIKHGNQLDPAKKVTVCYRLDGDRFEVCITDEGSGFDPADVPDPTDIENLERPCGRGLMLMRHFMNVVDYNDAGNAVRMMKILGNGKPK